MSAYTVRGLLTGTLYGRHLSATEAAGVVLRHATRRFFIRAAKDGHYCLWVEIKKGTLEMAYSQGRPIGVRADTKQAAWEAIAPLVIEAEWPSVRALPEDHPSPRLVWDKKYAP